MQSHESDLRCKAPDRTRQGGSRMAAAFQVAAVWPVLGPATVCLTGAALAVHRLVHRNPALPRQVAAVTACSSKG